MCVWFKGVDLLFIAFKGAGGVFNLVLLQIVAFQRKMQLWHSNLSVCTFGEQKFVESHQTNAMKWDQWCENVYFIQRGFPASTKKKLVESELSLRHLLAPSQNPKIL